MPRRDPRLWFPFALAGVGCFVIIGLLLLPKLGRGRPTEPDPNPPPDAPANRPEVPPWKNNASVAGELQAVPGLRVVRPDYAPDVCYVCEGDASPPAGAPATEEYADCWRGVARCWADPLGDVISWPPQRVCRRLLPVR